MEGGTLLQLRNLINRRNISSDISGKFNAAIDFFVLVITAHALAAAMQYFGIDLLNGSPTNIHFRLQGSLVNPKTCCRTNC